MRLPLWLYSEITFGFVNRWNGCYVIWLGTEFQKGTPYDMISNKYSFDLTVANFGVKIHYQGYPKKTFAYGLSEKKK